MTDRKEPREDEDQELVALGKKGDLDAFEALVRKYEKKMFNIAYRIAGDTEDAAEIVQDAFVSVYRNLAGFGQRSRFSTWLYAITVNTAKNRLVQLKTRNRHETDSFDDPSGLNPDTKRFEPASDDPSALELLSRKEQQKGIQECLNRLEQEFREAIVLRDIQGFSYLEIGNILSIAEGTVKSRIFRARETIKDCLKKLSGDM